MSSFTPIVLGIARASGKSKIKSDAGNSGIVSVDKIPAELKQKILERDDYTCKSCGFKSQKYQEVLQLNGNKADISENNLVTTCIFCHQCYNLDMVSGMRSGVLIWLPEIEQSQLNHIARAIYVARISQGPMADAARKALDILMGRREEVKNRLGTDDPYILSEVMRDYLGDKHYHFREKKLSGVKLFPLDRRIIKEADLEFNQFPQILAYWRSKNGPFGGKTPPQWIGLYKSHIAQ
jgi:intracellular multiplication protein IcmJ